MTYNYKQGLVVPFAQKFYKQITAVVAGLTLTTAAILTGVSSASPLAIHGCTFSEMGNVWKLTASCTATAQINIPEGVRLNGNNKKIMANFFKTDNDNNSVLGVVNADNVRIKNLTIDGTGGVNLHGINVYQSQNVKLDNVTTKKQYA